jgi:hypothetical protein
MKHTQKRNKEAKKKEKKEKKKVVVPVFSQHVTVNVCKSSFNFSFIQDNKITTCSPEPTVPETQSPTDIPCRAQDGLGSIHRAIPTRWTIDGLHRTARAPTTCCE